MTIGLFAAAYFLCLSEALTISLMLLTEVFLVYDWLRVKAEAEVEAAKIEVIVVVGSFSFKTIPQPNVSCN